MITQYTRIYYDVGSGEVKHCHTSTLPFPVGYEPIGHEEVLSKMDIEIEVDVEYKDFGSDQTMVKASEMISRLEVVGNNPQEKNGLPPGLLLAIAKQASVHADAVSARVLVALLGMFTDDPPGQGSRTAQEKLQAEILSGTGGATADFDSLKMSEKLRLQKMLEGG